MSASGITVISSIEELEPRNIVEFESFTDLSAFEDSVAQHIDRRVALLPIDNFRYSPLDDTVWGGRVAISELLRFPHFNGRMFDLRLEMVEDPISRLRSAKERNVSIKGSSNLGIKDDNPFAELIKPLYMGFLFLANASSSAGWRGQIRSELWYYPVSIKPKNKIINKNCQRTEDNGGSSIHRIVSKPTKQDSESYLHVHEKSQLRAFRLEQKGVYFARPTPMQS